MASVDRNELGRFPLMIAHRLGPGAPLLYEGFLTVGGEEYQLRIDVPASSSLNEASVSVGPSLQRLFKGNEQLVQMRLTQSGTVGQFLMELADLVERLQSKQQQTSSPPPLFYSRLVAELDQVGWDKVVHLEPSLTSLVLRMIDKAGREHQLSISFPPSYPAAPPTVAASLPEPVILHWTAKASSLLDVAKDYAKAFERYQDLWDVLDDIDRRTRVREPEKPTRADTERSIDLPVPRAYLKIRLLPAAPRAPPELRWIGSEASAPLREKYKKNLALWDDKALVRENLERLMEITFPAPTEKINEELEEECISCYSYRHPLLGGIPDGVCSNAKCSRPYHRVCMVEWLKSMPDSRQSFGTIFGKCPLCSSQITVKMD